MVRGVVEGFYGRPFEGGRRKLLLHYLSMLDQPMYMYCPKNDPRHRVRWRETYPSADWRPLADDMREADDLGVDFIFGISPWRFREDEHPSLRRKVRTALDSGAAGIAVLFDDIPGEVDAGLAIRQLRFTRRALEGIECVVFVCPTVYCDELLERYHGDDYLSAWREEAPGGWRPMWTGEQVVSRTLDGSSLKRAAEFLGGKPAVWDNLLADDYCLRRIYLAGLDGRPPPGHDYFLNPSECFPAALHGVYSLLKAAGVSCPLPAELGSVPQAWEVLGGFHHTPWSPGPRTAILLNDLKRAMETGPGEDLLNGLGRISRLMGLLLDDLEGIPFGWEIAPYARDLKRMAGWWLETLTLPSRKERARRLEYLMFRRLPFDHPLAVVTAELSGFYREGNS